MSHPRLFRWTLRFALLALSAVAFAQIGAQNTRQPTARDSALARQVDEAAEYYARFRTQNQTTLFRQHVARLRAVADSMRAGFAVVPPPPPPTHPLPTASFEVVCGLNLTCSFDARASTGYKLSFDWDCGATPDCTSTLSRFSFQYPDANEGSRTASLTVTDSLGRKAQASKTFSLPKPAPPDTGVTPVPPVDTAVTPLPEDSVVTPGDSIAGVTRAAYPKTVPSLTATVTRPVKTVSQLASLQTALDGAVGGDSILLTPGASYTGNFTLPSRTCSAGWVTIVGAPSIPAGRMTPARAATAKLARIVSPNNQPALKTANPTCNWRFIGVEITGTLPVTSIQYGLVWLGDGGWVGGGETQTSLAKVPQNIILDRVYIHGSSTLNSMRCLALNSGATVIKDSWFGECHASGFDSQAIVGWNGPGPYLIENNFLEGAGENVMFGGADPGITNLVPSDITIRKNHFYKPVSWKGGPWSIKNLFELKTAQRVLVVDNIFENNWPAAQEGVAIVIKSNANGCECTNLGTRDLTFSYNIVKNAPVALALSASDNSYGWTGFVHTQRVTGEHNVFQNIGAEGTRQALIMLLQDLKDVYLGNNTMVHAPTARGIFAPLAYSGGAARRIAMRNNVLTAGAGYLFHNSDNGTVHAAALSSFVGDGSWSFSGNVVGGLLSDYVSANPSGNVYLDAASKLGLTSTLALPSSSPYAGKGANVASLLQRTAGVAATPTSVRRSGRTPARAAFRPPTPEDLAYMARQPKSLDTPLPQR